MSDQSMNEWLFLALNGSIEERQKVKPATADEDIARQFRVIHTAIERLRSILLFKGITATDIFHETAKQAAFTSQETSIYPRVRLDPRYGSPSFYWERLRRHAYSLTGTTTTRSKRGRGRSYVAYVRRKGFKTKEKMKVVLLSEHIPINHTTLRIAPHAFSQEPQWAQVAGELAENQLHNLRHLSSLVSRLNQALARAEKAFASTMSAEKHA